MKIEVRRKLKVYGKWEEGRKGRGKHELCEYSGFYLLEGVGEGGIPP